MNDILVYRKGLANKILKDKECERELAAREGRGRVGDWG